MANEEKKEGENGGEKCGSGCRCCGGGKCCGCKAVAAIVLLVVGAIGGYFAGRHCGMCAAKGAAAPAASAPAAQAPAK